eukprot:2978581-Amphidinium_carterae.2
MDLQRLCSPDAFRSLHMAARWQSCLSIASQRIQVQPNFVSASCCRTSRCSWSRHVRGTNGSGFLYKLSLHTEADTTLCMFALFAFGYIRGYPCTSAYPCSPHKGLPLSQLWRHRRDGKTQMLALYTAPCPESRASLILSSYLSFEPAQHCKRSRLYLSCFETSLRGLPRRLVWMMQPTQALDLVLLYFCILDTHAWSAGQGCTRAFKHLHLARHTVT